MYFAYVDPQSGRSTSGTLNEDPAGLRAYRSSADREDIDPVAPFPNHSFVSLDLPTEAEQAEKEPQTFLKRHPPPVSIDEAQYAPGIFRHLKAEVDGHRSRNGRFLLTGSQKFTPMKNVSDSLAGRADIVELETLSFAEIRAALPRTSVESAIVRGGFPATSLMSSGLRAISVSELGESA